MTRGEAIVLELLVRTNRELDNADLVRLSFGRLDGERIAAHAKALVRRELITWRFTETENASAVTYTVTPAGRRCFYELLRLPRHLVVDDLVTSEPARALP